MWIGVHSTKQSFSTFSAGSCSRWWRFFMWRLIDMQVVQHWLHSGVFTNKQISFIHVRTEVWLSQTTFYCSTFLIGVLFCLLSISIFNTDTVSHGPLLLKVLKLSPHLTRHIHHPFFSKQEATPFHELNFSLAPFSVDLSRDEDDAKHYLGVTRPFYFCSQCKQHLHKITAPMVYFSALIIVLTQKWFS